MQPEKVFLSLLKAAFTRKKPWAEPCCYLWEIHLHEVKRDRKGDERGGEKSKIWISYSTRRRCEHGDIKQSRFHIFPWICNTFFHHFWTVNLLVAQTPISEIPTSWSGRCSLVYLLIISVWWEMNPQQCVLPRQEGRPAKAKHFLMKALLSARSENHSWV